MQQNVTYPTEWTGGIPRGSIKKDKDKGFMVVMSPPDQKQISKYFATSKYPNAFIMAQNWTMEQSDLLNLTRNKYRYINKDTIEVKLTQDKTFITDSTFATDLVLDEDENMVPFINKYPLQAVETRNRFNVEYQIKKDRKMFTKLIVPEYKICEYKNGNSLDLRLNNLKEFGTFDTIKKVRNIDEVSNNKNIEIDPENQFEYFMMDLNKLPKNKWILGKPAGTVFQRTGQAIYNVRVTDDKGHDHTKIFDPIKYKTSQETYIQAKKYQIETSYRLGMTKNLVKICDDGTIEIVLTKQSTTKLDICFLPLVLKVSMHSSRAEKDLEYYCATIIEGINKRFHFVITGFDIVDNINNNPLDNRLVNLRWCNYTINNQNKYSENDDTGVKFYQDKRGECYRARVKLCGKEYSRYFYFHDYGKDKAHELALQFRKNIFEIDLDSPNLNCDNLINAGSTPYIEYMEELIYMHLNGLLNNTIFDINKYIPNVELEEETNGFKHQYTLKNKQIMFHAYLQVQIRRMENLYSKLRILNDIKNGVKYENPMLETSLERSKPIIKNPLKREKFVKQVIENIFDKEFVKIRPKWLVNEAGNQMELDLYNKDHNLAIEIHGEQHYNYVPYFHESEDIFKQRQNDDLVKEQLCKSNEVNLIVVPYTVEDKDVYQFILDKMNELNLNVNTVNNENLCF
jgi:hypothetical protein